MWHGFLNINKERGITSHQVVANLRRLLKQSQVGHTGTLDPEAKGVLVVGVGEATRSFQFLDEAVKKYRAEIILGQATDTQDATGKVLEEHPDLQLKLIDVEKAISQLSGEIDQIPPMYSAVKQNGAKLYELARQGLEVERAARRIKVSEWTILNPQSDYKFRDSIICEITCSKGTYVRTLIDDCGRILGCGAHMGSLLRLQSGDFTLEHSITVEQVQIALAENRLLEFLIPITDALPQLKTITPEPEDLVKLKNGGKLSFYKYPLEVSPGSFAKVEEALTNRLVAIARLEDNGSYQYWQPVKVFGS